MFYQNYFINLKYQYFYPLKDRAAMVIIGEKKLKKYCSILQSLLTKGGLMLTPRLSEYKLQMMQP